MLALLAARRPDPRSLVLASLAAVAAKLGRFAKPMGDDAALTSSFTYGYHLDDVAYVDYLRALAQRVGLTRIEGVAAGLELGQRSLPTGAAGGGHE